MGMNRSKSENMVSIDSNELLKVADRSALTNLACFAGYGRTYIGNALDRGRIAKELLDKICSFYGADASGIIVKDEPKKVKDDNFSNFVQYTDLRVDELKKRIEALANQAVSVLEVEDNVTNLLSDCEKSFNEKIETVERKEDRDNAEIRKLITSLQAQIEQIKNSIRDLDR